MQIDVGYFHFVKDNFFDTINDPELMLEDIFTDNLFKKFIEKCK